MSSKGPKLPQLDPRLVVSSPQISSPVLRPSQVPTPQALFMEVSPEKPAKENGLYAAIGGDPKVLFDHLLEDPSRYPSGTDVLLQEMIQGRSDLSPEELQLLDQATLEYAQTPSPKRRRPQPPPPPKRAPEVDPWEL